MAPPFMQHPRDRHSGWLVTARPVLNHPLWLCHCCGWTFGVDVSSSHSSLPAPQGVLALHAFVGQILAGGMPPALFTRSVQGSPWLTAALASGLG